VIFIQPEVAIMNVDKSVARMRTLQGENGGRPPRDGNSRTRLGLACTLGLTAESVYRGLESGETLLDLLAMFNRHGTRPLSDTVLNSLRSWASKREKQGMETTRMPSPRVLAAVPPLASPADSSSAAPVILLVSVAMINILCISLG
jgi:hypothetical protein